ncbi:MAG: hypothetical protein ACRDQZ_23680, partial [Mycobacteriales bacterium]
VVVMRRGRLIEIQLRTSGQHGWAEAVERDANSLGLPGLKDGIGPPAVIAYYRHSAQIVALRDAGGPVDMVLTDELARLRVEARQALGID